MNKMMLYSIALVLQLATFTLADYGNSGCGGYGVLTAADGYLKSHNAYGTIKYTNNRDCSWNIDAPPSQRIRLETLSNIDIEDHSNCEYDYLSIYDGQDWNAKLIGTWCGTGNIPTILSSTRYLYVEFVTDNTGREDGFKMKYEFFRPSLYTGCYTDEFDCANKRCIKKEWQCDGGDDCGDNSDERNCTAVQHSCKSNEFFCDGDQCIPQDWRCDGDEDCMDKSDEVECNAVKCSADEHTCGPDDCITKSWVCDGELDCDDGSDENDCSSGSCGAYEFRCAVDKCVPENFICDGDNDCGDMSDERNCNTSTTTVAPPTTRSTLPPVVTTQTADLSGCGGLSNLTGDGGEFTTRNYPQVYPKNSFCTWTIRVKPTEKIELKFPDFKLETGSLESGGSRSCKYDFVSIYDTRVSIHTLVGRYCGQSAPAPIVSTGSTLIVQFVSDQDINKKGFKAAWKPVSGADLNKEASSGCYGPRDLTAASGYILSHQGEGREAYPESECVWAIGVSAGTKATLTFHTFVLESSDACKYDSLKVYLGLSEQSSLAGTYCGNTLPGPITSTTGFYLVFKADDSANGDGFNISYSKQTVIETTTQSSVTPVTSPPQQSTSQGDNPEAGCTKQTKVTKEGYIQSLDYGTVNEYAKNLDCQWLIEAPKDKVVKITFHDFNVEHEVSCGYDDLSVYEGDSKSSPLISRVCGDTLPKPVTSSSNQMFVQFLSDDDTGHEGFRASISFEDPHEVCQSDEFSCDNGKCIARKHQCNQKDDCGDNSDEIACFSGIGNCGVPSTKYPTKPGNTRIVGGTEANPHSWPWQAYVIYNYFFTCGGTLIHPQWIATAAHCLENRVKRGSSWQVTLGKHKKSYESEAVKVKIARIFEYPHYDETTTDSDVALFKLEKPVKITDEIIPICLPSKHRADNTKCYVTGWGDTKGTGYRTVLKQAAVPIINRNTCNSRQWLDGDVTNNMFCAGHQGGVHDGCEGDSGGPLSCEQNGRFHLQGITSWGVGCGLPKMPGVYTLVPNFVDWIKETIAKNP